MSITVKQLRAALDKAVEEDSRIDDLPIMALITAEATEKHLEHYHCGPTMHNKARWFCINAAPDISRSVISVLTRE